MFSYNCLIFQHCPAVSLAGVQFRDELIELRGHRSQPRVQRIVGQQLAGGAVAAIETIGQRFEVVGGAVQRLREGLVLEQNTETAFAGV